MSQDNFTYTVRCRACRTQFKIQLFESHDKNLFLVDKKDWYCADCKKNYFKEQTERLTKEQGTEGFGPITGTPKMVSWAVQIRKDLLNKADYLKKSLKFENEKEKETSDRAFEAVFARWRRETEAKWWIDHRKMTVRDISKALEEALTSNDQENA